MFNKFTRYTHTPATTRESRCTHTIELFKSYYFRCYCFFTDQKFQTVSAVAILLIVCVIAAVSLLAGTDPSNNIITITGRVVAFTNPFDSRLVSFQRHVDPSQECVFSAAKDFFGMPIYVFSLHSLGVKNPTSLAEGATGLYSHFLFSVCYCLPPPL